MGSLYPKIGIDILGGDYPPEELFEELLKIEEPLVSTAHLVFFAPHDLVEKFETICRQMKLQKRISFALTKDTISMTDPPLFSIRRKKHSSTSIALTKLKKGEIQALVSTGNTGALISGAKLIVKTLKGVKRPGLLALLPSAKKPLVVIDVGANVTCTPSHLMQFASIGMAYQKCLGIDHPKVGLLNIGTEKEKGRIEMQEAYKKLQELNEEQFPPIFIGNVEGKEAFKGDIDVLVTDGCSGNIFLKTAEGTFSFILEKLLEDHYKFNNQEALVKLSQLLNYAEYPGALISGVEGIIIKCHGYSNAKAIHSGIKGAIQLVKENFLKRLKQQLKS